MDNTHPAVSGMFFWMMESYKAMRDYGDEGVRKWQYIMMRALHNVFEKQGAERNSGPREFLKHVIKRDKALGIEVGGKIINENKFIYWVKDPFLPLKESDISDKEYEKISTEGYVEAKRTFFTPDFHQTMTKSVWKGDIFSEWVFERGK